MNKPNLIKDKSFDFALSVISLYIKLVQAKEFVLSKQLLKSATSVGANVEEALAAQSPRDFLSKMSIASKEARETKYWLRLLMRSSIVKIDYGQYLKEIESITNILSSIVKTCSKKHD